MNNRILIVDDDDDFRSLLSDLYTQADYQVKSVGNPLDALKILSEETFSLCVTDQSMPELKGIDFIDKCRSLKPSMPIIMVSAYLSDETTAKLQSLQIEVFHKPLNIMSLLRKTSELIKNANNQSLSLETPTESPSVAITKPNPLSASTPQSDSPKKQFSSYAFKSDAAKRIRKEIESIGDEILNMVLVGDPGTHFTSICEDIEIQIDSERHKFMYFNNKKINVFDISKSISDVPDNVTLVFSLIEAHDMGVAQKQALMKLHKRTGPFTDITNPIKFIFCLNEDLDTQFAKGAIDQDFYLIMGQKEIYIPRLDLCKEDIPFLAKKAANETLTQQSNNDSFTGFNSEATELLIQTEWDYNYSSLKAVIASALLLAKGSTITKDHLERAIESTEIVPSDVTSSSSSTISAQTAVSSSDNYDRPSPKPTSHSVTDSNISHSSNFPTSERPVISSSTTTRKKRHQSNMTPVIQSFTMLEDETELAKSILSHLLSK